MGAKLLSPGDTWKGTFETNGTSGASVADALPNCYVVRNLTEDASVSVTVTHLTATDFGGTNSSVYGFSTTVPTNYASLDYLSMVAVATVAGFTGRSTVDSLRLVAGQPNSGAVDLTPNSRLQLGAGYNSLGIADSGNTASNGTAFMAALAALAGATSTTTIHLDDAVYALGTNVTGIPQGVIAKIVGGGRGLTRITSTAMSATGVTILTLPSYCSAKGLTVQALSSGANQFALPIGDGGITSVGVRLEDVGTIADTDGIYLNGAGSSWDVTRWRHDGAWDACYNGQGTLVARDSDLFTYGPSVASTNSITTVTLGTISVTGVLTRLIDCRVITVNSTPTNTGIITGSIHPQGYGETVELINTQIITVSGTSSTYQVYTPNHLPGATVRTTALSNIDSTKVFRLNQNTFLSPFPQASVLSVGGVTGNVGGSVASVSGTVGISQGIAAGGITATSIAASALNGKGDWAKDGDKMDLVDAPNTTAVTAIQSGLATATALTTAAAAAASAATDTGNLIAMTTGTGTGRKFTTTAMSNAPSGGGGSSGNGNTPVTQDTNATGGTTTDFMRVTTQSGTGVPNVQITVYLQSDYNAGVKTVQGQTSTTANGRWFAPLMLNSGQTYTIVFSKSGDFNGATQVVALP